MASQTGVRSRGRQRRRERLRKVWAVIAAFAVTMPAVAALTVPAAADDPQTQYFTVTKLAQPYQLEPGQTFTYSIQATCEEVSCLDAQLTDQLPVELEGFALQDVTTTPGQSEVSRTVTWTENGTDLPGEPAVIGAATAFTVDFTNDVESPPGIGLEPARTFAIQLSLQVPEDIAPGDHEIVNTAHTTATNSLPDQADAPIRISVPVVVDVSATKAWTPSSGDFNPGDESTIALGVRNTSNVDVDVLTLQEPADAADGAATLADTNPFTITDFTGFDASVLPEGSQVRVDAYVLGPEGWSWSEGTAAASPALPAGVDAQDVGGLRFTYTGDIAPTDGADIAIDVQQRATHRNTDDDLSTATHSVDNTVAATAQSLEHDESATADASASYAVTPAQLDVSTSKNIQPNVVTGGETATGTLNATNAGSPVQELRLADLDFFTDEITFGGFTEAPTWPAGATDAVVIYHPLDGSSAVEVPFVSGVTPAAPSAPISGFEVVFSTSGNAIESAAYTAVEFTIETTEDVPSETLTNTVTTTATAVNEMSATASDSDDLTTVTPSVEVTLDKQVRPSTPVQPGESAYVSLAANGTATDRATLHEIVIEDAIGSGESEFWNAFNVVAIAPTQVPADTALTVEVRDADGTWRALPIYGPEPEATIFQLDRTDFAAAATTAGVSTDTITGARFFFDNSAGFANDVVVTPVLVFDARSELRGGGAITPGDEAATSYENSAVVDGAGVSEGDKELTDDDGDVGTGEVITYPGGPGPVGIDKRWDKDFVNAQAGDTAGTRLDWRVGPGFETVTITDPADRFDAPEETVFEAFDLLRVEPIGASNTPFTNGWYLKYDTITAVELYADGAWVTLDAPTGGWVQNGAFVGHTLTADQSATTTGVRISLAENTDARWAAQTDAALDPYAPAPGTGVATSSASRQFELEWQLRDRTRTNDGTTGDWVTEDVVYGNAPDNGDVINSVALEATPDGSGTVSRDTDDDTIRIFEPNPMVNVVKEVEAQRPIYVPEPGSSLSRPEATWTITANNASVAAAGHVRVTDPAAACLAPAVAADCQLADPNADPFQSDEIDWLAGNPFRYFDLTGIALTASVEEQIDLDATVVWLLRYDGESFDATEHTGSEAAALVAEDLTDVVGVSVTFQAENAGAGGVGTTITQDNRLRITLDSELRLTPRGTDVPLELGVNQTIDVDNRVFAQSYDDVLSPGVGTGHLANTEVVLTGGDVNIAPVKTVSPSEVLITNPDVPVTVTLGANQGTSPRSTLSPTSVVIEDQADSPDFWNSFDFTGLGDVTLPAGADRVQVDVYGPFGYDGALEWATGTAGSTAVVPVTESAYGDVQGIRFTFTREDGQYFDPTVPPADNWSASAQFTAQLRETYRDSGADMVFDGAVDNTQTSQSFRSDGKHSEAVSSTAPIVLSEGSWELEVNKLTNQGTRIANAGDDVPFRLSFRNAGTGFLTVTELRDTLPPELVHLGETEPVYSADTDGLLSEDVTLTVEEDGSELVFTWPEDGNRMAPGETFVIDLPFELQPTRDRVHNSIVVTTAETLDGCGNINGGTNWSQPGGDTSCATNDYVDTFSGPNLFAVKGVRGSLEGTERGGAYNPGTGAECSPTLQASGGSYYRAPCVAHSATGGEDDWVLRVQNAGTFGVSEVTIVDQLPVEGDAFLLSGTSRGSTYRPQLVAESLEVHGPEGTEALIEVTTSPDVCRDAYGSFVGSEPACEYAGEVWTPMGDDTDWAAVSGLRIHLSFSDELATAEWVDVTFSTRNVVATEADPSGAPAAVSADDAFAWNQFGIRYIDINQQGNETVKRLAPNAVGVHLMTGSVAIDKEITGPAAEAYAPDSFDVELACTIGDAPLDMGDYATVTLSEANDFRARVDAIPYSIDPLTSCTVTEVGDTGEFGETTRAIDPLGGVLPIAEPTDPTLPLEDQAVPAAQVATVTNDYQFTGLSVTKLVDTDATEGAFGPFDFELSCTSATGLPVVLGEDGVTTQVFTLEDGETFAVPENRIPVGADCTVTETDGFFADEIVIVGDNVTDHGDGSATVVPGVSPAEVTVTNGYAAGTLTVAKNVDGAGADLFGDGPFGFHAVCTYEGQELLDEHFDLLGGETRSFGVFPAGTECAVTETATGGATNTVLAPTDGTVEIVAPEDEAPVGNVTFEATNTFDLGVLEVEKEIDGAGAELFGVGPFEAQAVCTWEKDGETLPIQLPADGVLTLSQENGYRATVENLIVGADCVVTETATGGATASAIAPEGGAVTIPANDDGEQQSVTATLTNTFDLGVLEIEKVIEGDGGELFGAGPFEAQAVCTWDKDGEILPIALPDDGLVVLSGENDYRVTMDNLIVGADCAVTETATGGATSSTIAPEGGVVTIPATEAGEQQSVTVTLTNTFDVTSLEVTKEVQGNLDAPGAAGPFEIELVCEREVDGETVAVEIPGGPVRELSDDVGFSTVFEQLPVGAACELTETETSDADGTLITVALEGAAPETTESTSADVDLGLTTAPGQAHAVIVNAYDADPVPPVIDEASSGEGSGPGGSGLSQTGVAAAALAGVAALLTMLGLGLLAVRRRTARR